MNTTENEFVFEIEKPKSHTKSLNDDYDDETNQLLEKAKDIGIKLLNKTQDIGDNLITKTQKKSDYFKTHIYNDEFKLKFISFFNKYKKTSLLIGVLFVLGLLGIIVTPILIENIVYNKIPKNYKDHMKINAPVDIIGYVNYNKILPNMSGLTLLLNAGSYGEAGGLLYGYNYSDNQTMYVDYNMGLGFELTKDNEIHLSEKYNQLFKNGLDIGYLYNEKENTFSVFGGTIGKTTYSLYKDDLFKGLNKHVDNDTFLAFGKKSLISDLVEVSRPDFILDSSDLVGNISGMVDNGNSIIRNKIGPLLEGEFSNIISSSSYLTMSKKSDNLVINFIHQNNNKEYEEKSYEKFICSDFKSLYLKNNDILKDFECSYGYNKNEIRVKLSYSNFNALLKSLFDNNIQNLDEGLKSGNNGIFDESISNRDPFAVDGETEGTNSDIEFITNYYAKLQEKDWSYIAAHTRRSKNGEYIKRTEEEVKKLYINVSDIRQGSLDIQSIPFHQNQYYINTSVNLNEGGISRIAYCKTTKQVEYFDGTPTLITLNTNSCKD